MAKTDLVIDTDMGVDDVTALLMFLTRPASFKILAITVLDGNVSLPAGLRAARIVTALCGGSNASIPIIAGADGPLIRGLTEKVCYDGHGTDGLGGFTQRADEWASFKALHLPSDFVESDALPVNSEHAAAVLVRLAAARPGTLSVLAIGPLTNIALAISLDPNFLKNLKTLVIMGGSSHAKGNASHVAEFNFHCDPEAAHIVFHAASGLDNNLAPKLLVIPWETTVDHALPWSFFDSLVTLSDNSSKYAQFLKGYTASSENKLRSSYEKEPETYSSNDEYFRNTHGFLKCDIYAAVCIIDSNSMVEYKDFEAKIELQGLHTRGMLALGWHSNSPKNCRVVFKIDAEKTKDIFKAT
ncbi:hypothetical protein HK100_010048, partial [Physocladia obscura]